MVKETKQQTIDRLTGEMASARESLKSFRSRYDARLEELRVANEALSDLQTKLADEQKQTTALRRRIEDLQVTLVASEARLDELRDLFAALHYKLLEKIGS